MDETVDILVEDWKGGSSVRSRKGESFEARDDSN